MDIRFQGVLRDPLDNPMPNHEIRITALHTDETIKGSTVVFYTDASGAYDFYLLKGFYSLEVLNTAGDEYLLTGNLCLNQSTPQNITLEDALKYSEDIEPEDTVVLDATWSTWWNSLVNASLTSSREHRDQINHDEAHSVDLQETWASEDDTEHGAQRTLEVKAGDARIQDQHRVFDDEFAATGSKVETSESSVHETVNVGTEIDRKKTQTAVTSTNVENEHVGLEIRKDETSTTASGSWSKLKELAANIREVVSFAFGSNQLNKNSSVGTSVEESYDTLVGSKASSVTHTNDGTTSRHEIIVDEHFIGKTPMSPTLFVDTATGKVTVYGQLQISELLDENGDPIDLDPEDGDTIFQVYQYSDSSNGPWEDTVQPYHYWRRENWSVNGVVDPGAWSQPYQFRGFDGDPGDPGDTIVIEYQYSPDGVVWHDPPLVSGDKWRRERVVTNGSAGPWSDAGRIVGDDGETIETRSEYSIDGIYNWHPDPQPDDKWERRAVFVNGVQQGPWSDPIPFGKGVDGDQGDSVSEEARYGPTETIDGNWTAWGGTQLDTHFWRQTRTKTVDGSTGQITYSNVSVVHRIVGKPGSGWYTINNGTGNFPSDAQATVDFINAFGRSPTLDDHLTYTNNSNPDNVTNSSIKRCNSPEGSPVTWSTPAMVIQGDLIARGTISGDRLVANTITGNQISSATTIIAGSGSWTAGMNGNDLSSAGVYRYWRFWAGATNPATAPFRVYRDGSIYVADGTFNGTVYASAGSFTGAITASTLTLTGSTNITAGDVGAETPSGAQSKANTAETNAKNASDPVGSAAAAQSAAATDATNKANAAYNNSNTYTENRIYPDQSSIQIKSANYSSGSAGWAIDANGNCEFNNGTFRGVLSGATGNFQGTVYANQLVGDVVTALAKSNASKYRTQGGNTALFGTVSVSTSRPYTRTLVIKAGLRVQASATGEAGNPSGCDMRVWCTSSQFGSRGSQYVSVGSKGTSDATTGIGEVYYTIPANTTGTINVYGNISNTYGSDYGGAIGGLDVDLSGAEFSPVTGTWITQLFRNGGDLS